MWTFGRTFTEIFVMDDLIGHVMQQCNGWCIENTEQTRARCGQVKMYEAIKDVLILTADRVTQSKI